METIRIKCPTCGAILTVADNPSNTGKSVKCPVCEEKHLFSAFKLVLPRKEEDDKTNLGFTPDDETQLPQKTRITAYGYLTSDSPQRKYPLAEGVNLIGRKTYKSESSATVPIETEDMGLSRKHLYIEVAKGSDGIIRHYAYNASNKNSTTINGVKLENGDKIILHDSDRIQSSKTTLVFHNI